MVLLIIGYLNASQCGPQPRTLPACFAERGLRGVLTCAGGLRPGVFIIDVMLIFGFLMLCLGVLLVGSARSPAVATACRRMPTSNAGRSMHEAACGGRQRWALSVRVR